MQVCRGAGAAGKCCPAAPRASAQQAALLNEFASAWLQNARDYLAQGPWRTSAAKREHGKLCPSLCALSRVCGPERRLTSENILRHSVHVRMCGTGPKQHRESVLSFDV